MSFFKYIVAALIGGSLAYADKKKYKKGGTTRSSGTYVSPRKIKTVIVKEGGKEVQYKSGEFLNGAYKFDKGGKVEDDYKYIKQDNVVKVILNDGKEMKTRNGFWVKKAKPKKMAKGGTVKRTGVASKRVNIPRKVKYTHDSPSNSTSLMKAMSAITGKDFLRPPMQYIAEGDGYVVATNGHVLGAIRDESLDGTPVKLVCYKKKCDGESEKDKMKYPIWQPLVDVYSDTFAEFNTKDLFQTISEKINQYDTRKVKGISMTIDFGSSERRVSYDLLRLRSVLKLALQLGWDEVSFGASGKMEKAPTLIKWVEDSNLGTLLVMPLSPEVYEDKATFSATYDSDKKGLVDVKLNSKPKMRKGGKTKTHMDLGEITFAQA